MSVPSEVEEALEAFVSSEWTAAFPTDKLALPEEFYDPEPTESWAAMAILHGEGQHLGWAGPVSEWVEPGVLQVVLSVPVAVRPPNPTGLARMREYQDFVADRLRGKRVPTPTGRGVYLFEMTTAELPRRTDVRFYQRAASVRFEWYSTTSRT